MRVAFTWDGVSDHMGWNDGLWAALQILAERHTIRYFEPRNPGKIEGWKPDVILHWASSTESLNGGICALDIPKANCFAGGPIEIDLSAGYDLYFVENQCDLDKMRNMGRKAVIAFGVNETLFYPMDLPKKWDGGIIGTFAAWKRHDLFAYALKESGVAIGTHQSHEPWCYETCERQGVTVLKNIPRIDVPGYINQCRTVVNTANVWGGGQRLTLEAMACNVPPVVMDDSPKNSEYIEESGFGIICPPDVGAIRSAVGEVQRQPHIGRDYVLSKWTAGHYADALEKGLKML